MVRVTHNIDLGQMIAFDMLAFGVVSDFFTLAYGYTRYTDLFAMLNYTAPEDMEPRSSSRD